MNLTDLAAKLDAPDDAITGITDAGYFLRAQAPDAYVGALTTFLNSHLENWTAIKWGRSCNYQSDALDCEIEGAE